MVFFKIIIIKSLCSKKNNVLDGLDFNFNLQVGNKCHCALGWRERFSKWPAQGQRLTSKNLRHLFEVSHVEEVLVKIFGSSSKSWLTCLSYEGCFPWDVQTEGYNLKLITPLNHANH